MNELSFLSSWASAPGDSIADFLAERAISVREFASTLSLTVDEAKLLLRGEITIDPDLAEKLYDAVGGSADFWIRREQKYRDDLKRLDKEKEWLKEIPWRDMMAFGWLEEPRHKSQIAARCLTYFGVSGVEEWQDIYYSIAQAAAFRTSAAFSSLDGPVAAWLRQSEIEAESIACKPWDRELFWEELSSLRELTRRKNPDEFLLALQERCSAFGVAVVIVRAPRGCRHSGATRFQSPEKAILSLSFRHLSDDHFWFSFFHEAAHLLLHGRDLLFVEGPNTIDSKEEQEANEFASRILIPDEYRDEFENLSANRWEIVRFAKKIGISPGIVVGQLQHLGILERDRMNFLKRRFAWPE